MSPRTTSGSETSASGTTGCTGAGAGDGRAPGLGYGNRGLLATGAGDGDGRVGVLVGFVVNDSDRLV
jgi:hypothetical protein